MKSQGKIGAFLEKKKQWILIMIAVLCIGIGCLEFQENAIVEVASEDVENDLHLGDVQLVHASTDLQAIVPNEELQDNTVVTSNTVQNTSVQEMKPEDTYFAETRLERDTMYSEMLETYQNMLTNTEISADQKAIATQEITEITHTKNAIMVAENLIKNKGFADVVILENHGIVSIVVKSTLLTQEQIAQIQNIVAKEFDVEVKDITISNK